MTAFENHFTAIKKALNQPDIYDIWPDFEPVFDSNEYAWTSLRGLGETLLLNCGECDGPSDMRHERCDNCMEKRSKTASNAYTESKGNEQAHWTTIILCRIHSPDR